MKNYKILIFASCLLLAACESDLQRKSVVGTWKQISLESCINGCEPEVSDESVTWTFNDDSTYTIDDSESVETGIWMLEDSILTLRAADCDSMASQYRILVCTENAMTHESRSESDYGEIVETTKLIKE